MSDADFETIKKLQQERNAAAASKKGSRTFDAGNQRTDDTKQKLTDSADNDLYDRDGPDKFAGYHTSLPMGDDDEEMEGTDNTRACFCTGRHRQGNLPLRSHVPPLLRFADARHHWTPGTAAAGVCKSRAPTVDSDASGTSGTSWISPRAPVAWPARNFI